MPLSGIPDFSGFYLCLLGGIMDVGTMQALAQIGASITTSGFLLLAWILERRRADRLESILFEDWKSERVLSRNEAK
jgi:hypothetical protein